MSTRRQLSTTSLSNFVFENAPSVTNPSLDFCNAFWGVGDAGVEVLFTRMRGASRTMEDLENFWNERSVALFASLTRSNLSVDLYRVSIEEEYAKRLTKLTKLTLGEDE